MDLFETLNVFVDIMKMCICSFDGDKLLLIKIRPFKLSHFEQLFKLFGMEVV